MQGESKSISTDLGGVPWVPGVSRLVLGPGIRITEQPARTMADGLASFTIEVERHAAPGIRDGVVRTGGDGFTLPGLVRIEGEEPPPLQISPERRTHPGRFIRRLLKEREEEEGE